MRLMQRYCHARAKLRLENDRFRLRLVVSDSETFGAGRLSVVGLTVFAGLRTIAAPDRGLTSRVLRTLFRQYWGVAKR